MDLNSRRVDLRIEKEAAKKLIGRSVSGVSTRERGRVIEYTMPSGMHLATLTDVERSNGDRGTRLEYRTAVVAPWADHARRKARTIRDAAIEYRHPDSR